MKSQTTYFSYRLRSPEAHLALNGRNVPFVSHVKYVGVVFDKRITRILHIEMFEDSEHSSESTPYSKVSV
jgi:hypothetical protein